MRKPIKIVAMRSYTLSICTLLFALTACQPKAPSDSDKTVSDTMDPIELKQQIQALEDTLAMAYNKKDVVLFSRFYAENAVTYGEGREQLFGKKAMVDHFRSTAMIDTSGRQFEYMTIDVFQRGDLAVENGKWVQLDANGSEVDHGFYMVVFSKEGGKWESIRDIWNSSMVHTLEVVEE